MNNLYRKNVKQAVFILSLSITSCTTTSESISVNESNAAVPSITDSLRVNPPMVDYDRDLEITSTCEVYQYTGEKRINGTVTKTIEYYGNGKIASERLEGFKPSRISRYGDAIHYYDYKDTLLVQKRSLLENGDSTKTVFTYDENGQLIKETHYLFSRRLRADVDKGFGRPGGCIIDAEDYEKERSWYIRSVIQYKYDSFGRKTEYYAPSIHWGSQNRYTWSYNDSGKIQEHRSFDDDELIWIEEFSYSDTHYRYTRTWYDYYGTPKHLKEKSWEYTAQITHTFTLDDQGRVIEDSTTNEKNEFLGKTTTEYNPDGSVAEVVKYDSDGLREMTHVYEYGG